MITQKRLREVLDYDEETGVFRWRKALNRNAKAGTIAGCIYKNGYRCVQIDRGRYGAHRLAWLFVHGSFPEKEIDHVNGNKDDNRISNLRDVTHRANHQNHICHRNGKLVGVSWYKTPKKWRAQIYTNGKSTHLGYYDTEQEAHEAYLKVARELEVLE